jgi:hypothetical protein
LALASQHLVRDPVSLCYDQLRRLLHVAMADGGLATLTLYRAEEVTAWTRQETAGAFRALAEIEGRVWAVVERGGAHRLERFDDDLALDAALTGESPAPKEVWRGLDHLTAQEVMVVADGAPRGAATVIAGAVALDPPARTVQVGLGFRHLVEPLPPDLAGPLGVRAAPLRLVSVTFRLLETAALAVDLGRGPQPVAFRRLGTPLLDAPPPRFTGDVRPARAGLEPRRPAPALAHRGRHAAPHDAAFRHHRDEDHRLMAALASIATVVGAGASVYGQVRQAQAAKGMNRAQVAIDRQQEVARQQTLSAQQAQDRQARAQALGRTIAATRARLAASGQSADAGSAGAVTAGLKGDAAAAQDAEAGVYAAASAPAAPASSRPTAR